MTSLADLELFAGLAPPELDRVGRLLDRFRAPAGRRLFEQGEPGDHLCLVERGRLQVSIDLPDGGTQILADLGPGTTVGEIALLTSGRRSATITAVADTEGWMLDRRAFEALRHDHRDEAGLLLSRIGALVVARLRGRHEAIAADLGRHPDPFPEESAGPVKLLARPPLEHLASLLCFARFERAGQVADVVADSPALALGRGSVLAHDGDTPSALWLVVHGAVELTARRGGAAHRVRLAGPGRFVGHLGMLDRGPSPVVARARERCVLLAFPRARVEQLLADGSSAGRRFQAALYEDAARAVREAERPMALTLAAGSPAAAASAAA